MRVLIIICGVLIDALMHAQPDNKPHDALGEQAGGDKKRVAISTSCSARGSHAGALLLLPRAAYI